MRIAGFVGPFLLLGVSSTLSMASQEPPEMSGLQSLSGSGSTPRLTITQPATGCEVGTIWSGTRPSILVQGEADGIPGGYKLYLGVHPTHSDLVWSHEVPVSRKWLTQAYFGSSRCPPRDGESFELIALMTDGPPPKRYSELGGRYYASDIVTVKVAVRSWTERVGAFMKDFGISLPISGLFASAGGIVGALLAKYRGDKKKGSQKRQSSRRVGKRTPAGVTEA